MLIVLAGCQTTRHQRMSLEIPQLTPDTTIWRDRLVIHSVVFDYGVLENTPYIQYSNGSEMMCHIRAVSKDQHIDDFYLGPYQATQREWVTFSTQIQSVSVVCEDLLRE